MRCRKASTRVFQCPIRPSAGRVPTAEGLTELCARRREALEVLRDAADFEQELAESWIRDKQDPATQRAWQEQNDRLIRALHDWRQATDAFYKAVGGRS